MSINVLISFVGKHDPYGNNDTKGPLLTLIKEKKFDDIYLLPSARMPGCRVDESTEEKAGEVANILANESGSEIKCYIYPLRIDDPTDFFQILREMKIHIARIIEFYRGKKVSFNLNCTSGTQQMSACAYVIANAGYIPGVRLWQIRPPMALGKSISDDKRILPIKSHFVEEENIISRIRQYLDEYNFGLIRKECQRLENITAYLDRREKARLVGSLFHAYHLWDCMQFSTALKLLKGVRNKLKDTIEADDIVKMVGAQITFLEKVISGGNRETPENMVEIYSNALRCNERGAYFDVLARTWRICEGAVYFRLRNKWKVNPQKPSLSPDKDLGQKICTFFNISRSTHNMDALSMTKGHIVLDQLIGDSEYQHFMKSTFVTAYVFEKDHAKGGLRGKKTICLEKLRASIRKQRNQSVIAHGMRPVEDLDAKNCIHLAQKMLEGLVPGAESVLGEYPLNTKNLKAVVEYLA